MLPGSEGGEAHNQDEPILCDMFWGSGNGGTLMLEKRRD